MFVRRIVHTACAVGLLAVLGTAATGAIPDARRTTHFTFSGAVQLPGVTLPAGTYTFEVVNPDTGGDVVSVHSRDRQKVHLLSFTRPTYRPASGNLKATITLGESPAGNPPPVKAWFPEYETRGREFLY